VKKYLKFIKILKISSFFPDSISLSSQIDYDPNKIFFMFMGRNNLISDFTYLFSVIARRNAH